jgi:MSHA biogenesis protein MshN
MSLINEMLRDLDRRQALAVADGQLPPGQVMAVPSPAPGHQWFWTSVAVLMLASLAWVGWVAYQIHARPMVATELAFRAAEERKARPPEPQPIAAAPKPATEAPLASAQAPPPAAEEAKDVDPPDLFKLAQLIETPIPQAAKPRSPAPAPAVLPPQQKARGASSEAAVTRRDIPRTPSEQAEAQFRQGVAFLNQGRVSEAQDQFTGAITRYPGHQAARQALVSILIERGRLEEAKLLLEEGLGLSPGNVQYATVLSRILVERRDFAAAENVLASAQSGGETDADYQLVLGAVLQHLGKHPQASAAFEKATSLKPQPAPTWLAMAISLEASGRKAEALDAYRKALAANSLSQEARGYAEARIRGLR